MAQQENELTEPLVKWIESEMARRDWNQAELGRQAKLRPDVISRMLSRETAPEPETIKQIARAFGISLAQLQVAAADQLRDGQGKRANATSGRSVRESSSGYAASEEGEDEAAFLSYRLETLRTLGIAERDQVSVGVKLLMLQEYEEVGVERFGARARAFAERLRQRLQRGEPLGPDSAP